MYKRAYKQLGIVIFILTFISTSVFSAKLQLVEFNTDNYDNLQSYIKTIEEKGVTARHIFPPNTVIFEMYKRTDKVFENNLLVSQVYSSETIGLNKLNTTNKVHSVFRHIIDSKNDLKSTIELPFLSNCIIQETSNDSLNKSINSIQTSYANSLTGQYMIGHIAVGIYLLESTGSQENWWAAAEQTTFNEIVEGLNWLSEEANQRGVKVVWVYAPVEKISTTLEPIAGESKSPGDSAPNWIHDLLYSQGQSQNWDGAYGLANQLRNTYKTNWAVEIAVVMDENDADYKFTDNYSGYVTHPEDNRGPLVVMTYNNGGWGEDNLDYVTLHEVGHIFGASDEYAVSNCDCSIGKSYLQTVNGNCELCNSGHVDCVMNYDNGVICEFSAHELGWRDTDGDGASDPIDPNTGIFSWIQPVSSGDIIRIYDLGGLFTNTISITDDMLVGSILDVVLWDGSTYDNLNASVGYYNISKNGGAEWSEVLNFTSTSSTTISNLNFNNDIVSFTNNYPQYVRHSIFDSLGNLYSRPQFDIMKNSQTTVTTDISGYPDGIYTSEAFAWTPYGANSNNLSLQFINYICGNVDNSGDGNVDVSDVVYLVDFIFNNGADPVHLLSADLDCAGDFGPDISDLMIMVAFVYNNGPAPECCHSL